MIHSDALRHPWPRLLALPIFLLAGCAGNLAHHDGMEMLNRGNMEDGLAQLARASQEAPGNREFRIHYLNAQAQVIGWLLADAQYEKQQGHLEPAGELYRRVLNIERDNMQATAGLQAIEQDRRHAALLAEARAQLEANEIDQAEQNLALVLRENPQHAEAIALRRQIDEKSRRNDVVSPTLRQTFRQPVSLEFRDAGLKQVLEALSINSGLNFVLDKDVPPNLTITVFLRRVSVEDAIDVMLATSQLRKRVLNDTTLLIYPDTAAKQGEHQELVVKNFFLANAEAKQVMTMLKTVLKAKSLFADDKLNLLVMRDTPEMIRLADRMVGVYDVSEPEVMLELEVLEIQRSRLLNLGVQLPTRLTLAPLPTVGTVLTLGDLLHLHSRTTGATLTDTALNLQHDVSDTNLLANPRIRTHNREKALIKIGDRVPVITTTATANGFVSENVQYIDVGLKLEVEPTIFPNDEISIKLALEVSSVSKQLVSSAGTISYQISGRNAATVLRLKDGETQILGGLINDQDIAAANHFPGLGDLPILGRLFSNHKDSQDKTELVLSITPRLVRSMVPPAQIPGEFWSGTENDPRLNVIALSRPLPAGASGKATKAGGPAPLVLRAPLNQAPPQTAAVVQDPAMQTPPLPGAAPTPPAPAVAADLPGLHWKGPAGVRAGSSFKLQLEIVSPQKISSIPLQINFDPDVFELTDSTPGSFMSQNGTPIDTTKQLDGKSGKLFVTQTQRGGSGASGQGSLLEINFRALRATPDSLINVQSGTPVAPDNTPREAPLPTAFSIPVTPAAK